MRYLKGIKKTISLIALTAFILVNSVYAASNHNSLRPILKSNGLIAYDPAHTPADDTSYRIFCKGVNDHINTHPVDPYAPLQGTPLLRRKTAELINREVLQELSLQISSDDVTISLGTTGLLELFSRIFCNIERAALKSEEEKDSVALSKRAKHLYSQKSVFGRAVGLNAEKPRMMVIAAEDIEEGKLKNLLAQAQKNNTVVIFLDNDSSHRNISQVYNLLNQHEAYRANTVIITDISMRFGLAEYNVGAFVTFNKAIINAYNAAAGGSIAAVSQNTQAGFQCLIDSQLGPAVEVQEAGKIKAVNNPEVINSTFINMEPDPTLAISPVGMLDKHGLPEIFGDPNLAFQKTLGAALGLPPEEVLHIGHSNYEKAFAKAQNLGIVAKLEESDRRYTEELFKQLEESTIDREAFSQRLLEEPNSEIVEILQQALGQQLDADEIMALWSVFNVKKMHVGAPGFARDEIGMAALRLPEERLTPEQLKEIEKKLLNAGIFFANNVFGLSFDKGNVASGFYGSKPVEQDFLTALQLINNKDIAIAVPKPYYVGYRSSILGAGIPLRNISFFNTRTSNNWVPTPDEAKKAFDKLSPGTQKVLLLTTPDNPSGTAVPQDAIEKLLEFAVRNDAFIIFDVAYARLLFEGKPADLGKICENIFNRLDDGFKEKKGINKAGDLTKHFLIMQTQSKEILHPSPRLGAAMSGNTALIQKLREIKIFNADPIAKKAQAIIYGVSHAEYAEEYIQRHNAYLKRNVNHICAALDNLGIHYVRPQGAFYILFRIGKGPYIRFSFAGPFADIVQVMARIERLYPEWKEKDADITSDDLFKETAITSVSGNAFGAPEIKAVEDAEDVAEFLESRSVCGFIAPQEDAEKLISAIVTGNNSRFGIEIAFRGDDRNRVLGLIRFAVKEAKKVTQSKTVIAAGTLLNKKDGLDAIKAGARLIVAPGLTLSKKDIDEIHQKGAMVMMGAGSKDEALEAAERGADAIKVFPFNPKEHMEALKGPLPVDLHPYLEKVVIIEDDLDTIEFTTAGDVKLATFTNIYEFLRQKPTEEGYFILPKFGKGLVDEIRAVVSDKPTFITDGVTAELIGDGLLNTLDVGTALLITSPANIDEILWLVNASEEAKNLASQIKKALKGPFSISGLSSLDGLVDTIVMRKPAVCKELLGKGAPKTVAAYIIERLALPNVARGASSNITGYIEIAKGNPDIKTKAIGVGKMVSEPTDASFEPFELPQEVKILAETKDVDIIGGITSIRQGDMSDNLPHISYLSPKAWHDFVELMRRDSKINDVTKPPQTTILEQHPNANQYFYVEEGELVILATDVKYHGLSAYVVRKGEIVKVGANVFHIAVNKTRNTKFWVYNEDPNTYQKVAKVETTITCIGRRFEIPDTFETDPVILARSELPVNI